MIRIWFVCRGTLGHEDAARLDDAIRRADQMIEENTAFPTVIDGSAEGPYVRRFGSPVHLTTYVHPADQHAAFGKIDRRYKGVWADLTHAGWIDL